MKKTLFLALAVLASATLSAQTSKKDKKAKKNAPVEAVTVSTPKVELTTANDSTSYAFGMAQTKGLMDYLIGRMNLDTLYIQDFKQAFMDAMDRGTDPKFVAQMAGMTIAQQVSSQILPGVEGAFEGTGVSINKDIFVAGFIDGAMNDNSKMTVDAAQDYARAKEKAVEEQKKEIEKQKNAAYINENTSWLEENAKKEGVVTLPSGLQYKIITQGSGKVATTNDNVTVKYEGKLIDGTVFDSSYKRNPDTTSFKPSQVIKGWTEALCMMPEGSKWELYIPQELAYGERPAGKIKPYSTLIFTVEIVQVGDEKKAESEVPEIKEDSKIVKPASKPTSKKK